MCLGKETTLKPANVSTATGVSSNAKKSTISSSKPTILDANAYLEEQVQRVIAKAKESGKKIDPVIQVASQPKLYDGMIRAGTPIYVPRSPIPVFFFSGAAIILIVWALYETKNPILLLCCLACATVGYDLLAGFLHIVFDNPANLYLPVLCQPCLEFQMHHYLPTDITTRSFLYICGDLNVCVMIIAAYNLSFLDWWNNPIVRHILGMKLLMSYYGQFSHRSAHNPLSSKNWYIETLRSYGLMIPLDTHRSHHRPPPDEHFTLVVNDFCLIGVCNSFINFLYCDVTKNRWFWLTGFLFLGLCGATLEVMFMEFALKAVGGLK